MFKLTSAQETQGKKNRKLAPPFFPPLTVKSCLKFVFLYWGHYIIPANFF